MKETHDQWWERAVFYELYVDKFAGNFKDLRERLGYLEDLGITCIHILPYYPSAMVDNGYDVSDYTGVRQELGTIQDFENFVKGARARGIDIMVDFVLNHTSTEHPWFREAGASESNPKRDFYIWSQTGEEFQGSTNAFSDIKPSVWVQNARRGDFYFSTFYPEQADLNWGNPEVFSEMTKVLHFWTELGVRGFRLDAASHLVKKEGTNSKSLPETHKILKRIRGYVDSIRKDIVLLAEVHEELKKTIEYFGAGDECQIIYHFPLAEQLFLAVLRNDEKKLWKLAKQSSDIPNGCRWLMFLRNHDELSLATLPLTDRMELLAAIDPKKRFRFGSGASVWLATAFRSNRSKIEKAFSLLFEVSREIPARPIIYYGEEIGMKNEANIRIEKDTRRSVRGLFDWNVAKRQQRNESSLFSVVSQMIQSSSKHKTSYR